MVVKAAASRGLSLMKGITAKPFRLLKAEVDGMTPEEARAI